MVEAYAKHLSRSHNGELQFAFWRATDVSKLSVAAMASNIFSLNQDVSKTLHLFQHDNIKQVRHEFIGNSVASSACSETRFEGVEGTIFSIRLHAYVAMVITCLRAEGFQNVGGHRQKLYKYTFSSLFPVAFAQLVHKIRAYVGQWFSEEVTVGGGYCFVFVIRYKRRYVVKNIPAQGYSGGVHFIFNLTSNLRIVSVVFRTHRSCHGNNPWMYIVECDSNKPELISFFIFSSPTDSGGER